MLIKKLLQNLTNSFKKIIYLLYFVGLIVGGFYWLLLGLAFGGKAQFPQIIIGYFVGIGYTLTFSFPIFLTFIVCLNLIQFLVSKFTNYWGKKPIWYNFFNFGAVILTLLYAFLIIPYYLPNVGSVTYQVDYPIFFPQAILLLVWIIYDFVGFFVQDLKKEILIPGFYSEKIFGLIKFNLIQFVTFLILICGIFVIHFGTISNYLDAGSSGKTLRIGYESQINKMLAIDSENLLLLGRSTSNEKIFDGSRDTYLMLRNIKTNKVVWSVADKYINKVHVSPDKQKIYAIASQDYAEIKPQNLTNLLIIEAKSGQISQTISLNNTPFKYIFNVSINQKRDILLIGSSGFYDDRNIFNLSTNSVVKDQFGSMLKVSNKAKISEDGKYALNIGYQTQPVQFSVINLETGQKVLEYQKELTSYNGYNSDKTIAGTYVITFDKEKENFEVFIAKKEDARDQTDYDKKFDFNLITQKVSEDSENISFKLAAKNLGDKYGLVSPNGNWMIYPDQSSMKVFKIENQKIILVRTIQLKDTSISSGYTFLPNSSTLVLGSRYGELHLFNLK